MKRLNKIVIVSLVLLLPVLVYSFLKEYGSNQFDLPVYHKDGNPIAECNAASEQHRLTIEILFENNASPPLLIFIPDAVKNEYYSDLNNVLDKYPMIDVRALYIEGDSLIEGLHYMGTSLTGYLNFINCELILGEDHWLNSGISNKYVLIDSSRKIRGYYDCTQLSEIERLDIELDILLNYASDR